jgi:hypothetical protein
MTGEIEAVQSLHPRADEPYDEWFLRFASATHSKRTSWELRREIDRIHTHIIDSVMMIYGESVDLTTFLN